MTHEVDRARTPPVSWRVMTDLIKVPRPGARSAIDSTARRASLAGARSSVNSDTTALVPR